MRRLLRPDDARLSRAPRPRLRLSCLVEGDKIIGQHERFGFVKSAIVEQEKVAAGRESLCQLIDKDLKGVRIQAGQLQKEAFSRSGFQPPLEGKNFKTINGAD